MKALSANDQMFLWLERRNLPMHVRLRTAWRAPREAWDPSFVSQSDMRVQP